LSASHCFDELVDMITVYYGGGDPSPKIERASHTRIRVSQKAPLG
jgi:hypothetical protein